MRTSSWVSLLVIVLAAPFCLAQSSVEGVVKTAAGAPVSGAQVSLTYVSHPRRGCHARAEDCC